MDPGTLGNLEGPGRLPVMDPGILASLEILEDRRSPGSLGIPGLPPVLEIPEGPELRLETDPEILVLLEGLEILASLAALGTLDYLALRNRWVLESPVYPEILGVRRLLDSLDFPADHRTRLTVLESLDVLDCRRVLRLPFRPRLRPKRTAKQGEVDRGR